jgi:hypothetical protein
MPGQEAAQMMQKFSGACRFATLAAIACAGLLTAACTGPDHPTTGNPPAGPVPQVVPAGTGRSSAGPPQAQPAATATRPATHSASPTRQTSSSPPAQQPVPPCPTSGLRGAFASGGGAAGTFYYLIQFTNTSNSACTLFGYPGVSVVTGPSGTQVGPTATRISTFSAKLVTIAPGTTVHATMQTPNAGLLDPSACAAQTVHWLRVYPPGQFTPLFISVPAGANPVQICTGRQLGGTIPLGIYVVMPGSTGQ